MSVEVKRYQNISEIEEKLYLGDLIGACNARMLSELNIQMVVSVIDGVVPNESKSETIEYHQLWVEDRQDEDLLTHFPETNAWITYGQTRGQNVLVHCRAGISRSATIVVAFLMDKYQMTAKNAKQLVGSKRPQISPNPGFEIQLLFYENMNFRLNPNNRKLRQYLLDFLLFNPHLKSVVIYFDRRQYCENLTHVSLGSIYMCLGCGQKLFNEIHLIKKELSQTEGSALKVCSDYYIEPQIWMKDRLKDVFNTKNFSNTDIKCPICQSTVGSFNQFFKPFQCDCSLHKNLYCLYFRIKNRKIKINVK